MILRTENHCHSSLIRHIHRSGLIIILLIAIIMGTGCVSFQPIQGEQQKTAHVFTPMAHWAGNRAADFMDIFELGLGISSESKQAGWWPGSLGLYVEATSLLNLGLITHNGYTLDMEGRGTGAYNENRTIWGIGPLKGWRINQGDQHVNYYKDPAQNAKWQKRMAEDLGVHSPVANALEEMWMMTPVAGAIPAKMPIHKDVNFRTHFFGRPRGWQSWGVVGGEVAISEPFLLHHGILLKAKVDLSEIIDFALGFVGYDFKQDDRRKGE